MLNLFLATVLELLYFLFFLPFLMLFTVGNYSKLLLAVQYIYEHLFLYLFVVTFGRRGVFWFAGIVAAESLGRGLASRKYIFSAGISPRNRF